MTDAPDRKSLLRRLIDEVQRCWRRDLPGDPHAYRMAPVRRGPKGRSGAAAVAEPEDNSRSSYFTR